MDTNSRWAPTRHNPDILRRVEDGDILQKGVDHRKHLEIDGDQQDDPHQQVGLFLNGGLHAAKSAGAGGDLVGEAFGAHFFGLVIATAGDAITAGEDLGPGLFTNMIRFAGEQRFVSIHRSGDDLAIHHDLVAGFDLEQIADHDLGGIDGLFLAVAHHPGRGAGEQSDLIEGALGANFLDEADDDVDHDHAHGDDRIGRAPEEDQGQPQEK